MNPSRSPAVSVRLVLASIAGVWLFYFLLATLRASMVGFEFTGPMIVRRLAVTFAAMAVTALFWPLLRALDPRPLWVKAAVVLALALPASITIAAINQWAFADIEEQVFARLGDKQGIKIRRDESGNMLVDVPDSMNPGEAATPDGASQAKGGNGPGVGEGSENDKSSEGGQGGAAIPDTDRISQIADLALGRYFVLLAWAALYLAFANAEQARSAERREGEYRRAAKAAELRSLRYQVNPHFLFNTLNSLSALVMTGKHDGAERMIQTLSTFYRRSLSDDPTADHSLTEEIELQRLYLEIEAVRFPVRLKAVYAIPAELGAARVPGMILQPLVENAVKYAVAVVTRPVTVTIAAAEEYGRLVLTVSDDGPGAAKGSTPGFGIGLANVRDRLAARYGDTAQFDAGPAPGGGWRAEIRLPLERHG